MVMVGAFGFTLLGIALLENAGLKVNEGFLSFAMTIVKFGSILYIVKMASSLFL